MSIFIFSCAAISSGKNPQVYSGTLAYYDDYSGTIVVENAQKKQKEFTLANTARILQDGRLSQINTADWNKSITVYFTKKRDRAIAVQVLK